MSSLLLVGICLIRVTAAIVFEIKDNYRCEGGLVKREFMYVVEHAGFQDQNQAALQRVRLSRNAL